MWGRHCNPMCHTSLTMALGLLALQNGKPMFPKATSTKWQTLGGGKQPSPSHLDPLHPSEQISEHASPIFTIIHLFVLIFINLYLSFCYFWILLVDSFGVRVALQPHLPYESDHGLGPTSTTKWQTSLFSKQMANPGGWQTTIAVTFLCLS